MNLTNKRVCVTGGHGFLGKNVTNALWARGVSDVFVPSIQNYDFRQFDDVKRMYDRLQPDVVINLAAFVGGVDANINRPAEFFYNNLMMGMLLMDVAREYGVEKFVQMGSACEYPADAPQPLQEKDIWSGYPDATNGPYGVAKRALLEQGQAYRRQYGMNIIHLLSTNLYGPGDNFDPSVSHVISALIKRFVEAKKTGAEFVSIWGTGKATRDFLFVRDAAQAVVLATENYDSADPVNLGSGREVPIWFIAERIRGLTGFQGDLVFDTTKPEGQLHRFLDVSRAKSFGFEYTTSLETGLKETIAWYERSLSAT